MNKAWVKLLPGFVQKRLDGKQGLQQIIGNTSWLFAERGLQMSLALLVGVWMARYLGPEQFGILNYVLAFIALLQPLSELGINAILTRDIVRTPEAQNEILGTAFILRLAGGLLSFSIVMGIVWLLQPNDFLIKVSITLLSLGNLTKAFGVIDFWFQSKVLSKHVVLAKSLILLVSSGVKVSLILLEAPLIAFIAIYAIDQVLSGMCLIIPYYLLGNSLTRWRFNFSRGKALLSQSWPLILSAFGAVIYLKIDQVMLGEMSTNTAVGAYAVAARLSEVWYFVPVAIASSIFPFLLKSKEQGVQAYHAKLQKIYDYLFCAALLISLPMSVAATPLITTLYGEAYREAGTILSIHIWASVFIFMRAALSKWLIAEDMFIFSLVTHGLGAGVNVGLNMLLIPDLGGVGAAIATVISYATASYLALFVHPRTLGTARMMTLAFVSPVRAFMKLKSEQ